MTGGDDLTMIEVSEATTIIQEAAHEDANIIFGAVVDPSIDGAVKITVIATGFEDPEAAGESASAAKTPVDLETYAGWKPEKPVERVASVSLARRRVIELPSSPRARSLPVTGDCQDPEIASLETPAFLRRQSES